MSALRRQLHVTERPARPGAPAPRHVLLAHGYGCDQSMWRHLVPLLQDHHCISFDFPGTGAGSLQAYDPARHASLQGYAQTLLDLVHELDLPGLVIVGHSVSAMVAALAAQAAPERVSELVMICPSPCYRNHDGYPGGFEPEQIDALLQGLAEAHQPWAHAVAPMIMGNADRPELAQELVGAFCAMDPTIALRWARATFLSDFRAVLPQVGVPCLVLHCREDAIAPPEVGRWTAARLAQGRLAWLDATGHCPQLSHPQLVASALLAELADRGAASSPVVMP